MATRTVRALHAPGAPVEQRRLVRRAARFAGELLLAAALLSGVTIAVLLLLLLVVVAAPFAAAPIAWLVWRSRAGGAREARRVRSRLRSRTRTLGLIVLAGSRPGVIRLATAGAEPPAPPPRAVP